MTLRYQSKAAKKLALQCVLENIEQKKKGLYLQEIIAMGKKDNVWIRILTDFFNSPIPDLSRFEFGKN